MRLRLRLYVWSVLAWLVSLPLGVCSRATWALQAVHAASVRRRELAKLYAEN